MIPNKEEKKHMINHIKDILDNQNGDLFQPDVEILTNILVVLTSMETSD